MHRSLGLAVLPVALAATSLWCLVQAIDADQEADLASSGLVGVGLNLLAEPAAAAQDLPSTATGDPATTPLLSARRNRRGEGEDGRPTDPTAEHPD